ncbi:MAG: HAD-IIIA family hydrolase [Oscillospiraceae bacterium]|nr:HAD-IIIA family hydrolase [Oscillospiraceae bacterium]
MKYEAVLFDYDGTVADSIADIAEAANRALRLKGLPAHGEAAYRSFAGSGARVLLQRAAPAGTDDKTLEALYNEYVAYYAAHANDRTQPFPGVPEMLSRMHAAGLKLAVISNKPDAAVQPGVRRFFASWLKLAVGERPGVRRKPWPDMLEAAAEEMGVSLSRCLYVGDTEVDLETARAAGIDCAAVTWGFRSESELRAAGATFLFDTPEELTDFVLQT